MSFVAVAIGVCFGSFGNVLIDRLPAGASIVGRSRCDGCRRPLSPLELVPIASWLALRGTCRSCGARIPLRVPFVEALSGALAYAAVMHAGNEGLPAACLFLALWSLLLIAVIDIRTKTIPDALTLVAFAAGLAFQWVTTGTIPTLGPLVAFGFFALQWLVSRGRWIGSGDVLLAAAAAVVVGSPTGALWLILLSYSFGASIAIALLLLRRLRRGDMVPFGPFIVIATYAVLLLGERLVLPHP